MKYCSNDQCKNAIPDDAIHCPYCGQNQIATKRSAQPFFIVGIIMLSIMIVLLGRELSRQPISQNASVDSSTNRNVPISTQSPVATSRIAFASQTPVPPTRTSIPFTRTPTIPTPTQISTSTSCSGAPSPRIKINDLVRVVTSNDDRLVLRSVPEINDGTEIQRLDKGTQLKIFVGPVCVQDSATSIFYWFWLVKVKSTGILGWVAEGDRSLYYLEKIR